MNFVNRQRQDALPMLGQIEIEPVIFRKLAEIIAPLLAFGKISGKAGKTIIHCVAATVNDAGIGKEQVNKAQIIKIYR